MERRPELDGLRGIAVILTVVLHYVVTSGYVPELGPRPVENLMRSLSSGVDIFFVLSGFLIGGIVLDHGRTQNFYRVFGLHAWDFTLFRLDGLAAGILVATLVRNEKWCELV